MVEAFSYAFMQRALLCGLLVAVLAGWFGAFVVQRKLSFLGSGLAHAAFGGVALGILMGWSPLWIAVPFTVIVALAIVWVQQRTTLAADTAIGVLFSVSMALGIVFLSKSENYTADAFSYLFGSILAISTSDVIVTACVVALMGLLVPSWGRWAYATFDRDLAEADGVAVVRDDYLLAVSLAVTIVVSMKVVGIVLIAAFLVIPPATARIVCRRFSTMTLVSIVIGCVSVMAGLAASWHFEVPTGPAMILVQAGFFFLAVVFSRRR